MHRTMNMSIMCWLVVDDRVSRAHFSFFKHKTISGDPFRKDARLFLFVVGSCEFNNLSDEKRCRRQIGSRNLQVSDNALRVA